MAFYEHVVIARQDISPQQAETLNEELKALIESLGMKADRVAVELNRDIAPRDRWSEIQLNEGDRLEIVHFVGGGMC